MQAGAVMVEWWYNPIVLLSRYIFGRYVFHRYIFAENKHSRELKSCLFL